MLDLTPEEELALRYMLSERVLSDRCFDASFCYSQSCSILEKLGGHEDVDRPLRKHPIVKTWYENSEECHECGNRFSKSELVECTLPTHEWDDGKTTGKFCKDCHGRQTS